MARSNRATIGMNLLWAALALDGLGVVLTWAHVSPGFALARLPIFGVIGFIVWWFITAEVAAGHIWARVVYLVLVILGVLGMVGISLIPRLAAVVLRLEGWAGTLEVAELLLQAIGIGIVFSNPAYGRRA